MNKIVEVEKISFVRDEEGVVEMFVTFAINPDGRAKGFSIPIQVPNTGDVTTDIEVARRHLHLREICEATSAAVN